MSILKGIKIDGSEDVHQLDYENAVANKPFGKTTGLQEILPEQDAEMMYADGFYMAYLLSPHLFALELGKTVVVNIDGTEYTTKTALLEGQMAFGNMAAMGGEDTGEPFFGMMMAQGDNRIIGFASLETPADPENPGTVTHKVSIRYDTTIIKKLGKEYVAIDWNDNDPRSVSTIKNRPFGTIIAGSFVLPETVYTCISVETNETDSGTIYQAVAMFDGANGFAAGENYGLLVDDALVEEATMDSEGEFLSFEASGVQIIAVANMVIWTITEEEYAQFNEGVAVTKTFGITYQPGDGNDLDIPVPAKYLPGICPELIWTNDSPTAEFAGQTLTFDKNYSMYVVKFNNSTTDDSGDTDIVLAGQKKTLKFVKKTLSLGTGVWNFKENEASREITDTTANTITFGSANCYDHSAGTAELGNNAYAIPTEIYGIR